MKRLKISSILAACFLLFGFISGCAEVRELAPSPDLNKEKILAGWKREPDIITRAKKYLKYGADEVWIYKYPSSDQDRFYFKNGVLIREEEITSGSL